MTLGDEIKTTLRLATPIMGAHVLHIVMLFVDNLMVGRLGPDALGGLALAGAFYSSLFIIVIGLMGALSPLVSEANGAERFREAAHHLRQAFLLGIGMSALLLTLLYFSEPILLAIGQQPRPSAHAAEYLRAMMWTLPAQVSFVALRNFSEGTSDSTPSVAIALLAAVLNVPLDYALIFGAWGLPELGVAGAGYATALLTWMTLGLLGAYVALRPRYRKYHLLRLPRPDLDSMGKIVRIGLPLAGAMATEMGFFVATTFLMGRLGELELAAHQVALNAASLVFMLPLGLSFAVSIRIGHHLGTRDRDSVRRAWLAGIIIAATMASCTAVAFLGAPQYIAALYDQPPDVQEMAVKLLMVAGLFQLVDALQVVGMGALRGLQDTRFAFFATTFSFWACGVSFVVWRYAQDDPTGMWGGLLFGLAIAAVLHHSRTYSDLRRLR